MGNTTEPPVSAAIFRQTIGCYHGPMSVLAYSARL